MGNLSFCASKAISTQASKSGSTPKTDDLFGDKSLKKSDKASKMIDKQKGKEESSSSQGGEDTPV